MVNNRITIGGESAKDASKHAKFDIGRVTEVRDHERGDKNPHRLKVKVGGEDVDERGQFYPVAKGDVSIPSVDEYVLIAYRKGDHPLVLGTVNVAQQSDELFSYTMGDRRVGHAPTDANIFLNGETGGIKIESDTSTDPPDSQNPPADVTNSFTLIEEGGRTGRDETDYTSSYIEQRGADQFISSDVGGTTYGIGGSHQGIVASQPTRTPPYTEFVDVGFRPKRLEFSATLHQGEFNEPHHSADSSYSHSDEAHGSMSGLVTMTPLSIPDYIDMASEAAQSSQTEPRQRGEPYTDSQLENPTQTVYADAGFGAGTESRSYHGDGQCIRLIHTEDTSLTEQYRCEARVESFHDTGFMLEWFIADDEDDAVWNDDYQMVIRWVAYQ